MFKEVSREEFSDFMRLVHCKEERNDQSRAIFRLNDPIVGYRNATLNRSYNTIMGISTTEGIEEKFYLIGNYKDIMGVRE